MYAQDYVHHVGSHLRSVPRACLLYIICERKREDGEGWLNIGRKGGGRDTRRSHARACSNFSLLIGFRGFFGNSTQISDKLYPEKAALARSHLDPIIHCCISHLQVGSPTIFVYEADKVFMNIFHVSLFALLILTRFPEVLRSLTSLPFMAGA